jgi:hypothetical protein
MALPLGTTGSLRPAFASARLVSLAVKHSYTFALYARLPTVLRVPLRSSVTLWEETAPVKLPTRHCPPILTGLGFHYSKAGISRVAPPRLAPRLHSLPAILHRPHRNPISSCSKGSRGLSVLSRVGGIFTAITISPSPSLRQRPDRYAIRAGRNLPDKEFRYLRTVIVTADIHWGFSSGLLHRIISG